VNRNFTQTITVHCSDVDALVALLTEWDVNQAHADVMGYVGTRILADRVTPDVYVIEVDFGIVDPEVSAYEEALRNNERPETQEWARQLRALTSDEPEYRHYDEVYRTGF
jgi:uncharacterized protein (DUF58 family)